MKDFITIAGKKVRVEANWNALIAFMTSVGKDDFASVASFATLKPSEISALMAACINEGERLEGREANYTALSLGEVMTAATVSEFLPIYLKQTTADVPEDSKKG